MKGVLLLWDKDWVFQMMLNDVTRRFLIGPLMCINCTCVHDEYTAKDLILSFWAAINSLTCFSCRKTLWTSLSYINDFKFLLKIQMFAFFYNSRLTDLVITKDQCLLYCTLEYGAAVCNHSDYHWSVCFNRSTEAVLQNLIGVRLSSVSWVGATRGSRLYIHGELGFSKFLKTVFLPK